MAIRALSLSGGGARGSFQLGALAAIYDVYGFRPDVVAGTSVGSVNGIMLALGPPPVVNDPVAILASVAAGTPDPQLSSLRALEVEWSTFTSTSEFFLLQPEFDNPSVQRLLSMMNTRRGDPSMSIESYLLDRLAHLAAVEVIDTVDTATHANAIFNLDPVSKRLNDPAKMTLEGLKQGTPVYFAAVALESGRLRYIDGQGTVTERDGITPVLSALNPSDVDAAVDQNQQPIDSVRAARITGLINRYRMAITAITLARGGVAGATSRAQRLSALDDIDRSTARAGYLLDILRTQITGLTLRSTFDPRRAVLASAAMPVFFDPISIGAEWYIDGGVREIIPLQIAIRAGVTDVVGICCSPLELPLVDNKTRAGLADVGLRALTEIALNEVTFSDIAAVRDSGMACTVIAPTFSVHGATEVDPPLIDLSIDYGWMRAGDEMHPAADSVRGEFRWLSDLITKLRMRSLSLEQSINEQTFFSVAASAQDDVVTVRTLRWIVREALRSRAARGLPTSPQARRWWIEWNHEMRPLGPFESPTVWSKLSAFSTKGTEVKVASAVADPDGYEPDGGALVDAGNDRVFWIVRGAAFAADDETEATTTHTPVVVVPHDTTSALPRVPRGSHVIAEQTTPTDTWIVRNGKRYHASSAAVAASGLAGQPVAIVPPHGLDQIIDGGQPYWVGGLYISDSAHVALDRWEPTPQSEGTSTSTAIGLTNVSAAVVNVTSLTIATDADRPGIEVFRVSAQLPLSVQAGASVWVPIVFAPPSAGPINGTISVATDDPTVGNFALPLFTSATPIGPHGELQVTPATVDLGVVRVGQTAGMNVTLSNTGGRDLQLIGLQVVDGTPPGQFAIPYSLPSQLTPGQTATIYVSSTPSERGRSSATMAIDVTSTTNAAAQPFAQHVDLPLAATAGAPVIMLAGVALAPAPMDPVVLPRPGLPRPRPPRTGPPAPMTELTRLDVGALPPGTSARCTFWVRNVGDLPLIVADLDISQPNVVGVTGPNIFPATVPPGGEVAIELTFLAPATAGTPASASLRVLSDDPTRPQAPLTVIGRAAGAHLTLQPNELLVLAGSPPTGVLTITSDGTDPATVRKAGIDNRDFSAAGWQLPALLAPGTSISVSVTCSATAPGQHRGRMELAVEGGKTEVVFLETTI